MSIQKAWDRLSCKHSPSTTTKYSPIRPAAHLLKLEGIFADTLFRTHAWTLLNTEEFYYQNTSSLVYHHANDIKVLSRMLNSHVLDWSKRLSNYELIGKGQYGRVYRATDKITLEKYAVKSIIPPDEKRKQTLFSFLTSLFRERNIFAELNESIFFVRLLASFQSDDKSEFLFILDYCLCNLLDLIKIYPLYEYENTLIDHYFKGVALKKVSEKMNKILYIDFEKLCFIYLFEMCCGLHYMATKHIVHSDIKPENMLIDRHGHLKFSDFGLSIKNDWFSRNSARKIAQTEIELENENKINCELVARGTKPYFDPELMLIFIFRKNKTILKKLKILLKDSVYFKNIRFNNQNFLADLFSVGVVFIELITGGIVVTENSLLPSLEKDFFPIQTVYLPLLNNKIFIEPFQKMSTTHDLESVFQFVQSIFLPRHIRSEFYRKEIEIYQQKDKVMEYYIDLDAIENISYYLSKSLTRENVGNFIFSENFLEKLSEYISQSETIEKKETGKKLENFNLHPILFASLN